MSITPPGLAMWNQRHALEADAERLRSLGRMVDWTWDMNLYQWTELLAFALEFRPDLILELGRQRGNSTCAFLEAAHLLRDQQPCRVVSMCLTDDWQRMTVPRLRGLCPPEWFARGEFRRGDILEYDVEPMLGNARRVLVFWDAHGFEVAEWVLGKLLPKLAGRPHAVMMHDMTDMRYNQPPREYGATPMWKGEHSGGPHFWIGDICSHVAQCVSILDFAARNRMPLHSADESLHADLGAHPERLAELKRFLGDDLFSLQGHWYWFTLDEAAAPLTFPPPPAPRVVREELPAAPADGRKTRAAFPPPTPGERLRRKVTGLVRRIRRLLKAG